MRLLVTGSAGLVGHNFCGRHADRFELITTWHAAPPQHAGSRSVRADLTDAAAVEALWEQVRPEAVLHLAAMTAVDTCEADPARARALNVEATARLAALAARDGARMVYTSTDLVFDGARAPYAEADPPTPLFAYGRTKAEGEQALLAASAQHLACRVALCYGPLPGGGMRQIDWILRKAEAGEPVTLYADEHRTPIDSLSLADALAELLVGTQRGLLHLGGADRTSRLAFGRALLERAGHDPELARPASAAASPIPRPRDVSLDTRLAARLLATPLPGLAEGFDRVFTASG